MKKITIITEDTSQNMVAPNPKPHQNTTSITKIIIILGVVSLSLVLSKLLNQVINIPLIVTFIIGLLGLLVGIATANQITHKNI